MNLSTIVGDSALAITVTSGLTQAIKTAAKLQDQFAYLTTVAVGLLVTGGFDFALFAPVTAQDWAMVVLHGLVVGLSSAGLYKYAGAMADRMQPPVPPAPPVA